MDQGKKQNLLKVAEKVKSQNGQNKQTALLYATLYQDDKEEINGSNFNPEELQLLLEAYNLVGYATKTKAWAGRTRDSLAPQDIVDDSYKKEIYKKIDSLDVSDDVKNGLKNAVEKAHDGNHSYRDIALRGASFLTAYGDGVESGVDMLFKDGALNMLNANFGDVVSEVASSTMGVIPGMVSGVYKDVKSGVGEFFRDDKKYSSRRNLADQFQGRMLSGYRSENISGIQERQQVEGAKNIKKIANMVGLECSDSTAMKIASMMGSATADQIRDTAVKLLASDPEQAAQLSAAISNNWDTLFKGDVGDGVALYDSMVRGTTNVDTMRSMGVVAERFTQKPTMENGYTNADDALAAYKTLESEGYRIQNYQARTEDSFKASVDKIGGEKGKGWDSFTEQMRVKGMEAKFDEIKKQKIVELEKAGDTEGASKLRKAQFTMKDGKYVEAAGIKTEDLRAAGEEWRKLATEYRDQAKSGKSATDDWSKGDADKKKVAQFGQAYVDANGAEELIQMRSAANKRVIEAAKGVSGAEKIFTGDAVADQKAAAQLMKIIGGAGKFPGDDESASKQTAYIMQLASGSGLNFDRLQSVVKLSGDVAKQYGMSPSAVPDILARSQEIYSAAMNDPNRQGALDPEKMLAMSVDYSARSRDTALSRNARWLANISLNKKDFENPEKYKQLKAIQEKLRTSGESLTEEEANLLKDTDGLMTLTGANPGSFSDDAMNSISLSSEEERNIQMATSDQARRINFEGLFGEDKSFREAAVEKGGWGSADAGRAVYDLHGALMSAGFDFDETAKILQKGELTNDQKERLRKAGKLDDVQAKLNAANTALADSPDDKERVRQHIEQSSMAAMKKKTGKDMDLDTVKANFALMSADPTQAARQAKREAEVRDYFKSNTHGNYMTSFLEADSVSAGIAKAIKEQGSAIEWGEAEKFIDDKGYSTVLAGLSGQKDQTAESFFQAVHGEDADKYVDNYADALNISKAGKTKEALKQEVYDTLTSMSPEEIDKKLSKNDKLKDAKSDVEKKLKAGMEKSREEERKSEAEEAAKQPTESTEDKGEESKDKKESFWRRAWRGMFGSSESEEDSKDTAGTSEMSSANGESSNTVQVCIVGVSQEAAKILGQDVQNT